MFLESSFLEKKASNSLADDNVAVFKCERKNILDIYISTKEDQRRDILKDMYKTYESYDGKSQEIEWKTENEPFGFTVFRKETKEPIFNTKGKHFEISKNYREFTTTLPTGKIFGLGESNNPSFLLVEGTYTMFNRDEVGKIWDGQSGRQTYGSHPMYLIQEKSGKFSVVFLQNSHPMDVELKENNLKFKMVIRKNSNL